MPSSFESKYPAITRWAKEFGVIEIGHDGFVDNYVKALDKGGMPWGGKSTYRTIDEALEEMERGIKAFLKEQGLDKELVGLRDLGASLQAGKGIYSPIRTGGSKRPPWNPRRNEIDPKTSRSSRRFANSARSPKHYAGERTSRSLA